MQWGIFVYLGERWSNRTPAVLRAGPGPQGRRRRASAPARPG